MCVDSFWSASEPITGGEGKMEFTNKDSADLKTFIVSGKSTITRNMLEIEIHAKNQKEARAYISDFYPTFRITRISPARG
jgi:hypothetical protein